MVTERLRSHWRRVIVSPVADWLTVRSRAPLIAVSVLETKFPPTEMLFFICKSWAWAASVPDSSTMIQERRRVRVGIDSTPWVDIGIRTLQASRPTVRLRENSTRQAPGRDRLGNASLVAKAEQKG